MASIRRRGKNSYQITVSNGYDITGKKIIETKTITREDGFTDKQWEKELDSLATEFEREVQRGTILDGEKLTFAQVVKLWLEKYAERELELKTVTRYKELLDLRILPALGHIKLQKLQPTHLIDFYANIKEAGLRFDTKYIATPIFHELYTSSKMNQKKLSALSEVSDKTIIRALKYENIAGRSAEKLSKALDCKMSICFAPAGEPKPLSDRSVLHHHALISSILQDAVEWQLIRENPADRVKAPGVDKKIPKHYNRAQTKELIQALADEPIMYRVMVLLDSFTGTRVGEFMGLNWDTDVLLDEAIIKINEVSQYVRGHGTFTKEAPKNFSSIREIPISPFVVNLLRTYKSHWNEQRLKVGDLWKGSNRLFVTWDGRPLYTYTLTNWMPDFLKRHNLPHITPHGLRHTFASLLAKKIPIPELSALLGHARPSTTSDIYVHFLKDDNNASAQLLEDMLIGSEINHKASV